MTYEGFILTTSQVIRNNTTELVFQGRLSDGLRFHWIVTHPRVVFFIEREETWTPAGALRKEVELRSLRGQPVDALYFRNTMDLSRARDEGESRDIRTYEADVNPAARFLMEHFIQGAVAFESEPDQRKDNLLYFVDPAIKPSSFIPKLKLLSIDIECSQGLDLYSVALYGKGLEWVLMMDPAGKNGSGKNADRHFLTERDLLAAFFSEVRAYDPDALIGWNVVGFDLHWLSRKCEALGMAFDLGTDAPVEMLEPGRFSNQWIARIAGRIVLDGIDMTRMAYVKTEGYALSTVAHEVLGRNKLIETTGREKIEEITRLFNEDKENLARYNLEDAKLVYDIFGKLKFSELAVHRAQLRGLPPDRVGGSVAAFDFLYLPRLHRHGYVADTYPVLPEEGEAAPGGLVLDSEPGFYRNVAIFDFKSLYPSIIRTFHVDPLAANVVLHRLADDADSNAPSLSGRIVKGPAGLEFAKDFAILPHIIEELWQERDRAKKDKNPAHSYAVKIIMNSFYGVLGSPGCRFFDPRLAGTITRIGHWILTFSRAFIEEKGFRVIYGDTDSLFVHLGEEEEDRVKQTAAELSSGLNGRLRDLLHQRFGVVSHLDIEFEKNFTRFFMPTIRGEDTGSKKRYAGLLFSENGEPELYFVGMESSRRDWTALAKAFQADLFSLLFLRDISPGLKDELGGLIQERRKALYEGKLDDKLVYSKGIHKRLRDYKKNVPPHVRAARKLGKLEGRVVHYVMTKAGPEPIQKRSGAAPDYDHYSDKQLAPIADMVLRFFDTDYRAVTQDQKQLDLF